MNDMDLACFHVVDKRQYTGPQNDMDLALWTCIVAFINYMESREGAQDALDAEKKDAVAAEDEDDAVAVEEKDNAVKMTKEEDAHLNQFESLLWTYYYRLRVELDRRTEEVEISVERDFRTIVVPQLIALLVSGEYSMAKATIGKNRKRRQARHVFAASLRMKYDSARKGVWARDHGQAPHAGEEQ